MRRPNPILCTVFLACYALTGGIGGSSTLCIGAEGHFELGGGCGPSCHECQGARPCPSDRVLSADEDGGPCGPCTDIPLLSEHIPSCGDDGLVKAAAPNDDATAVIAPSSDTLFAYTAASQLSIAPGPPHPALADLATVVLLC